METDKKSLKIINFKILFFSITCVIFFCLSFFSKNDVFLINNLPSEELKPNQTYYLPSLDYSGSFDGSEFEFPYVSFRPDKFDLKKELNLSKLGKADPLEISTRRMVQLYNWSGEICFKNKDFVKDKDETGHICWEDFLNNYFDLLKTKLDLIKKENLSDYEEAERFSKVRTLVNIHSSVFSQIISRLQKSSEKKQYLTQIINENFKQILTGLVIKEDLFNPGEYVFSLVEINKNLDFGKYKITLINFFPDEDSDVQFFVNKENISRISGKLPSTANDIFLGDVTVGGKQDKLRLIVNSQNYFREKRWQENAINEGGYLYQLQLPLIENILKYYLFFNVNFAAEGRFWLEAKYFDSLSNLSRILNLENPISFQKESQTTYGKKILLAGKNNGKFITLNIFSNKKLDTTVFSKLNLLWFPLYNPIIKAEKINDFDDKQVSLNTTGKIVSRNNKKYKMVFFLSVLVLILSTAKELNYSSKIFLFFKKKYQVLIEKMPFLLKKYALKLRWVLLSVVLMIFFSSLVDYKNVNGSALLFFVLGLVLCSIGFSLDSRLLLTVFVLSLFLSSLFRIFWLIGASEWFAVWSYVLLLSIILLELVCNKQEGNSTFDKFLKRINIFVSGLRKANEKKH